MTDHGPKPYVVDIEDATLSNTSFRDTLWTGSHLQLTVMCITPGDDIGLELHADVDQFLRIESGTGQVHMGPAKDELTFTQPVKDDDAILVPAGTWHNVVNTGNENLLVYSIYGPPDHVPGTHHATKADAEADPHEH